MSNNPEVEELARAEQSIEKVGITEDERASIRPYIDAAYEGHMRGLDAAIEAIVANHVAEVVGEVDRHLMRVAEGHYGYAESVDRMASLVSRFSSVRKED